MKPSFFQDPVLLILLGVTLIFAGLTLFIALHAKDDGQTFTVFAGMMSSFGGAALLRVKAPAKEDHPDPGVTVSTITERKVTEVPVPPVKEP